MKDKVVIGTRGSMLALWQANWVKSLIEELNPSLKVELMKIKTTGDKILDVPLAKVGGKGLFVKEIEEAMQRGEIDLAVHSMKDVPTYLPDGLHLSCILKREDPRDAFISNKYESLASLPAGAKVGTSSLRRSCQIKAMRTDLDIISLRGNFDTRIRKMDDGEFDAIILAAAGANRLGLSDRVKEFVSKEISLPAIAQGAVGIECRQDDEFINDLLKPLKHPETEVCVRAERATLRKLEGGCQVPIAAHAELDGETISMKGLVGSVEGDLILRAEKEGPASDAEAIGIALAEDLLAQGADKILAEFYDSSK